MAEEIKITDNEIIILQEFINNDIIHDNGWQDCDASTWSDGFGDNIKKISHKSVSGTCASLTKKGIFCNNGESFGLTNLGRSTVSRLVNEEVLSD